MYIRLVTTAATASKTMITTVPTIDTAIRPLPPHPFFPHSSCSGWVLSGSSSSPLVLEDGSSLVVVIMGADWVVGGDVRLLWSPVEVSAEEELSLFSGACE